MELTVMKWLFSENTDAENCGEHVEINDFKEVLAKTTVGYSGRIQLLFFFLEKTDILARKEVEGYQSSKSKALLCNL